MNVRIYLQHEMRALYEELGRQLADWSWVAPMRESWPLVNFGRSVEGLPPLENPFR